MFSKWCQNKINLKLVGHQGCCSKYIDNSSVVLANV